ncbi:MAG: cryptococcal mannosyltransferase 1-domain-containing protein [Monoraphidium minutum]|nr:MAG: cryptococcal mannosyltransferase 1-domain-containing protein [Monoraphidium minutum]
MKSISMLRRWQGLGAPAASAPGTRRVRCAPRAPPLLLPAPAHLPRLHGLSVVAAAAEAPGGRRAKLVNVRRPPAKKRRKASLDAPVRVELGGPAEPGFEARLTNAINAAYGPRKLGKLVDDYGRHMTPYQLGCALALLAGFATGRALREAEAAGGPGGGGGGFGPAPAAPGGGLTARQRRGQELVDACRGVARRCTELLRGRLALATPLDCARAAYSSARLQLADPPLLAALEAATTSRMSGAQPEALVGLAVGMALGAHTPAQEWLREWRVESFAALGSFSGQELANAAFALATWREAPSDVWLARWAMALRQRFATRGACPPPALVRAAYALAAMPPAVPTPATQLLAAAAAQHQQQQEQLQLQQRAARGRGGGAPPPPPPPPPPSERLPSFNWMCAFLAAARGAVDALSPGELATLLWALARLGRPPDAAFADAWYRAAAARAAAFGPGELALALHALGALRPGVGVPGAVPGRFARELLPAARRLLPRCSGVQLAQVVWGLAELRLWPGQAWLDDWLAAMEPQLPGLDGPSLADAAWGLARLGADVPGPWLAGLVAAVDARLEGDTARGGQDEGGGAAQPAEAVGGGGSGPGAFGLGGGALAERAAAQARGYVAGAAAEGDGAPPPGPGAASAGRAVDARCLAVLIWALARLGHRPPRGWLLAFKAASGEQLGAPAAQQLARFIAGALLQAQRREGGGAGPLAAVAVGGLLHGVTPALRNAARAARAPAPPAGFVSPYFAPLAPLLRYLEDHPDEVLVPLAHRLLAAPPLGVPEARAAFQLALERLTPRPADGGVTYAPAPAPVRWLRRPAIGGAPAAAGGGLEPFLDGALGLLAAEGGGGPLHCDPPDASLPRDGSAAGRVAVVSNLRGAGGAAANAVLQVLRLALWLPPGDAFVVVYEDGSSDGTRRWLGLMQLLLAPLGVPSAVTLDGGLLRGAGEPRIAHLARLRNALVEPLFPHPAERRAHHCPPPADAAGAAAAAARGAAGRQHPAALPAACFDPGSLLFLNDVFFCRDDAARLLLRRDSHLACGYDVTVASERRRAARRRRRELRAAEAAAAAAAGGAVQGQQNITWAPRSYWLYDIWVARDVSGARMDSGGPPFTRHAASRERGLAGLPFPVYCCWSGMARVTAEAFRRGLRFRAHEPGECAASECSLLCDDMARVGLRRAVIDPLWRVSYESIECCDLAPGSDLVDWAKGCRRVDVLARGANYTARALAARGAAGGGA